MNPDECVAQIRNAFEQGANPGSEISNMSKSFTQKQKDTEKLSNQSEDEEDTPVVQGTGMNKKLIKNSKSK